MSKQNMSHFFANRIITWYQENKRDLPWRNTQDPYRIWLSEIILQQTRVQQGLPYYKAFVAQYPSVSALAQATEEEVLKLWQGLGYYSRARNLHYTARYINEECNDVFPKTYKGLLKLKGVGDYTASAIASFCYGAETPTVDGNVYRVLARFFGIGLAINSTKAKKEFKALAQNLIDVNRPALFNQAIMEFGALHCTPKLPKCTSCIFSDSCMALQKDEVEILPFKEKKIKITKRYFNYLVLKTSSNATLLTKRIGRGIWQNLYEFPLVECKQPIHRADLIENIDFIKFVGGSSYRLKYLPLNTVVHKLSHQHLHIQFWLLESEMENKEMYTLQQALAFPTPIVIHAFLEQLQDVF
jgi:A/G-specific adenine glycosylase